MLPSVLHSRSALYLYCPGCRWIALGCFWNIAVIENADSDIGANMFLLRMALNEIFLMFNLGRRKGKEMEGE